MKQPQLNLTVGSFVLLSGVFVEIRQIRRRVYWAYKRMPDGEYVLIAGERGTPVGANSPQLLEQRIRELYLEPKR